MIELRGQGLLLNPRAPSEISEAFIRAWSQFESETPALFVNAVGIATSGSTSGGVGSIIVLSNEALETSALAVNRRLESQSRDVWGLALPIFHVGGYSIPLRAGLSGSQVAMFDQPWRAVEFQRWLQFEKVTLLSLVPTQLFDLVQAGIKSPSQLRAVVVGGGRLDDSLHTRAHELGWPVLQSYGLTECCSQVATARVASDGRELEVLDHVEARIDHKQKLWIRSKALLSARIVFDPMLNARLERPVTDDGWFETEDRAEIARLGFSDGVHDVLKVLGREGETVKILGELVDLVRVRAEVDKITGDGTEFAALVQRTWVVAIPDSRRGHELVFVFENDSTAPGTQTSEVKDVVQRLVGELRRKLAPYELPTRFLRVEKIPRSSLGKVLSTKLTDEARKRSTTSP